MSPSFGDPRKMLGDLKERLEQMKAEAAALRVEASAGGGMVRVVANGQMEIVSIAIEDGLLEPDQRDMVPDLVTAAVNEALRKAQAEMADRFRGLTGGLGLPPIPGLFG